MRCRLVMVIVVARIGRRLLSAAEFGHERRRRWRSAGARSALICPDHHRGRTRRGTGDGDDLEPHGTSPRDPSDPPRGAVRGRRRAHVGGDRVEDATRRGARLRCPLASPSAIPTSTSTARSPSQAGAPRPTASRSWCSSTSFRRSPGRTRRTATWTASRSVYGRFSSTSGISYLFAGSLEHLLRDRFTPLTASALP